MFLFDSARSRVDKLELCVFDVANNNITGLKCLAKARLYSSVHTADEMYSLEMRESTISVLSIALYNVCCHEVPAKYSRGLVMLCLVVVMSFL